VTENLPPSSKRPRRRLSAAELELWFEATRSVKPRRGHRAQCPQPEVESISAPPASAPRPPKGAGPEGASKQAAPKMRPSPSPAPIDRRLRQKLSRGRAAPDAEIDLHGMRREEAFVALRKFLLRAQSEGARLVLVVTGKGNRAASGDLAPGVLRKSVPGWLCGPEYHAIVAGFEEAARPHGGSGALYVRLRRRIRPAAENEAS
jgi:DNA-nicking Smr family endonuclease